MMINSESALRELRESWWTVRILEAEIEMTLNSYRVGGLAALTGISCIPESLLLLFGLSVLEEALVQLRNEGQFDCKKGSLHSLMNASRQSLPWQDFDAIDSIRSRRNEVAHDRRMLQAAECHAMLNTIARELLAWRVLDVDFKGGFRITFAPTS